MDKLNLPTYKFSIKSIDDKAYIFDIIRKKYVLLTPEENVRQHFVHYLINEKQYPKGLIAIEKEIIINRVTGRGDIVVFNQTGEPNLLVECKAPGIKISQKSFDQIARYCSHLKVRYIVVTNGIKHYCCEVDLINNSIVYLIDVPEYRRQKQI